MGADAMKPPLPEPTVRCGEYAGPPGEGADCHLWDRDEMHAYADTCTAALSARVAELEADAKRYRWLRKNCYESYPSGEGSENKDAYLVITGHGYGLTDAQKDAAIDAAMKGQP